MSEEKQSQRNNNEEEEWEEEEFLVVMENKHFDSVELLRACKRYSISVRTNFSGPQTCTFYASEFANK